MYTFAPATIQYLSLPPGSLSAHLLLCRRRTSPFEHIFPFTRVKADGVRLTTDQDGFTRTNPGEHDDDAGLRVVCAHPLLPGGPLSGESLYFFANYTLRRYVPADGKHWVRLEKHIPQLKAWGIDNIWVPPG
jgi:hypothetical protein